MAKSNSPKNYGNDSISSLKGADRVRKRPAVIFGSDGLEGCEHAVFEILSNAIDEAREGHGSLITVTRYEDHSIEVEDFGRGCPVDWNEKEQKFNWELVFCELYAGGKYNNNDGDNYEYSLGLNGLGSCATQYASAYFDAVIHRDGFEYTLHFEKGENVGGLKKEPYSGKKTGSRFRWKPDLDVFTDINIPVEYYTDVLKRQAVVNAGVTFRFRNQVGGKFETTDFQYENGIEDYVKELAGRKCSINRSKGLGENEPDMMWLTTMNPETRRLIKVMPEDVERTAAVFDLLLGDNLQGRKDHIAENGYKYLELADIS